MGTGPVLTETTRIGGLCLGDPGTAELAALGGGGPAEAVVHSEAVLSNIPLPAVSLFSHPLHSRLSPQCLTVPCLKGQRPPCVNAGWFLRSSSTLPPGMEFLGLPTSCTYILIKALGSSETFGGERQKEFCSEEGATQRSQPRVGMMHRGCAYGRCVGCFMRVDGLNVTLKVGFQGTCVGKAL